MPSRTARRGNEGEGKWILGWIFPFSFPARPPSLSSSTSTQHKPGYHQGIKVLSTLHLQQFFNRPCNKRPSHPLCICTITDKRTTPRSADATPSVANANQKFPSIRHRPRPWQRGPSTSTYSLSPHHSSSYRII